MNAVTSPVRAHLVTLLTEKFDAPADAVDDGAALQDLDLDSLARVELVVSLQEHWGIALDDDADSAADVTVAHLIGRVSTLLAGSTARPAGPAR
ncbi:acyl carrier protein [Kitasatospora sp. NPDC096147]|uniref:acyl carrier protein n=1 Tax=Kitasatospora sp. NPDC096147 TaxID=3364093 RepID=UPI00382F98C8